MNKTNLAGCVILDGNKILLLKRTKKDWYELPGGVCKELENDEDTAKRELKEELMIDVEIIRKLGVKDFEENNRVMVYNWFLAKIKHGQNPVVAEPGTFDSFRYIPIDELENHKLSPNMQNLALEIRRKNITL